MTKLRVMPLLRKGAISACLAGALVVSVAMLVSFPSDSGTYAAGEAPGEEVSAHADDASASTEDAQSEESLSFDGKMIHWVQTAAQFAGAVLKRMADVVMKAYQMGEEASSEKSVTSSDRSTMFPVFPISALSPAFPQGP